MTKKQLEARRARNRELATADAKNRCAYCKRNLLEVEQWVESLTMRGTFCSDDCLAAAEERDRVNP